MFLTFIPIHLFGAEIDLLLSAGASPSGTQSIERESRVEFAHRERESSRILLSHSCLERQSFLESSVAQLPDNGVKVRTLEKVLYYCTVLQVLLVLRTL